MKKIFTLAALAAVCAGASAQAPALRVSDISVKRAADELVVAIDINPSDVNPGRDREVVFTPVVRSAAGTDSVVLPSVTVAGRNRYYSHIRNNDMPAGAVYAAGSKAPVHYRAEVPFLPWMERSTVVMDASTAHCCDAPVPAPETPLARLDYTVPTFAPDIRFIELTGDSLIERTAEGKAFVDFVVNRTEIRDDYRGNRKEIAKIIASIDKVKNDPDAIITRITIKGFASPEGPYDNNVRLSIGRTASLKDYVRRHYNFDPEIMSTDYEPEDWEGLYAFLDTCDLPHRDELIMLAHSDMEPDARDHEMRRRYPQDYKYILDNIYPGLRHSDYTVKYNFRTYATVEELKRVFAATPDRLRPVDFQRIAATYDVGSPEYNEVYTTAVAVHPFNAECNINAANVALRLGDLAAASRYLDRSGDRPEAIYTRGALAALQGDLTRAAECYRAAAGQGFEPAASELERVDAIMHRATVEYLITPEK